MSLEDILHSPIVDKSQISPCVISKQPPVVGEIFGTDAQWKIIKEYMIGDLPTQKAKPLSLILDNIRNDNLIRIKLKNTNYQYNGIIIIPITIHVFSKLLAHDLIGVQAVSQTIAALLHHNDKELYVDIKTSCLRCNMNVYNNHSLKDIDIDDILKHIIVKQIIIEMDQDMLCRIVDSLKPDPRFIYDHTMGFNQDKSTGDEAATIAVMISRQANLIGKSSGIRGNWCVVSPFVLNIVKHASPYVSITDTNKHSMYVGKLGCSMDVYCNQYWGDDAPVLIGHKNDNELDTGMVYCPYIPVDTDGPTIDPNTFESNLSFYRRDGYSSLDIENNYRLVGINPK